MKTHADPFFVSADITQFSVTPFTNRAELGAPPQDWIASSWATNTNWVSWSYTPGTPQVRPYEREFVVRSANQTYRVASNASLVASLVLNSDLFGKGIFSDNMVALGTLPCIQPCPPAQADGSPPDYTCLWKIIDDILLDRLVMTNESVHGITFTWDNKSTVRLQGTSNHVHWTNVAYVYGNPGTTTWTTNAALNGFGNFFRIQLISIGEHVTNLPPLSASASSTESLRTSSATASVGSSISALTYRLDGEEMVIEFTASSGQTYLFQAVDQNAKVAASQTVQGRGTVAELRFKTAELPTPVFFSVKPLL